MSLTALTALRAHTMDNTDHCHVPSVDLLLSRSAAAERSRGHGPSDLAPADARPGARVIPHASSFAALFFFLNDRAPPEISPLPLPAPLPIWPGEGVAPPSQPPAVRVIRLQGAATPVLAPAEADDDVLLRDHGGRRDDRAFLVVHDRRGPQLLAGPRVERRQAAVEQADEQLAVRVRSAAVVDVAAARSEERRVGERV